MRQTDIELRQIRHALTVAAQGSLSGAATQLQMSLSSLSRSISTLERQVGAALFRRSGSLLAPTDLGRVFIERGRAMVAAADDLDRLAGQHAALQVGRVVVGLGAAMCDATATTVAAQMMVDRPAVTLELRSSLRDDLVPPLRQGELDLLIAAGAQFVKEADLEVHPLPPQPLLVIVRRGHPLAERPGFDVRSIFNHPVHAGGRIPPPVLHELLNEQAAAESALARTRPMPATMGTSVAMLLQMAEQTDCVTACTPALARRGIEAGRLVPLAAPVWLRSSFAVVRKRSRKTSPDAESFFHRFKAAHETEVAQAHRLIDTWLPRAAAA